MSGFPSTLWSEVLAAGQGAEQALEALAARYLTPVYAMVRARGWPREDAEDLTHEFFLFLLETQALGRADPERGRFRAFLAACLRNFLSNEAARRRAAKRGGDRAKLSLDVEAAERSLGLAAKGEDPQACFDRMWALEVLEAALARLHQELSPTAAEAFRLAQDDDAASYRRIAAQLGLTEQAVAASVYRSRKKLRQLLLDEVRATVSDEAEVVEELNELFRALGSAGTPPHLL